MPDANRAVSSLASGFLLLLLSASAFAEQSRTAESLTSGSSELPSGSQPASRETSAPDEERARRAFEKGKALVAEGNYQEACGYFERSLAIVEGIGTMYNLAACLESIGRTASAHALYTRAARHAAEAGQTDRSKAAQSRANALEHRQAKLVVELAVPHPNVTVQLDDKVLEAGQPVFIDPGRSRLTASAQGRKRWSRQIDVPAGPVLVSVSVPVLEAEPALVPQRDPVECDNTKSSGAPKAGHSALSESPRRSTVDPKTAQTFKAVAIGLSAIGLGGVAAGTVFGLKYRSDNQEAEAICRDRPSCPQEDIDRHAKLTQSARASRTGAFISFGVGGTALAGALATYLAVPLYRRESPVQMSARPASMPDGSFGLTAEGSF